MGRGIGYGQGPVLTAGELDFAVQMLEIELHVQDSA